jgi:hypothetical protein
VAYNLQTMPLSALSRLMGADEVAAPQPLKAHRRQVVDPAIAMTF